MIISKTPFRVSFFGGGTDYPTWLDENEGFILSTTIDKYCYITLKELPSLFNYNYRIRYYLKEETKKISEIKHPVIRNLFKKYKIKKNIDLVHHSDLPAMSGLGSSSSFTVGLTNCLNIFNKISFSKYDLAHFAINFEQKVLKEKVGCQDQLAASYGGLNFYKLYKNNFKVYPINISNKNKLTLEKSCFLLFTGFTRKASLLANDQIKRISINSEYLKSMNELTIEAVKLLEAKKLNLNLFFELIDEQWDLKKRLSSSILPKKISLIIDQVQRAGVNSMKLLGAGGVGFILCLVKPSLKNKVIQKLNSKYQIVDIKFDNTGSHIIYNSGK